MQPKETETHTNTQGDLSEMISYPHMYADGKNDSFINLDTTLCNKKIEGGIQ